MVGMLWLAIFRIFLQIGKFLIKKWRTFMCFPQFRKQVDKKVALFLAVLRIRIRSDPDPTIKSRVAEPEQVEAKLI